MASVFPMAVHRLMEGGADGQQVTVLAHTLVAVACSIEPERVPIHRECPFTYFDVISHTRRRVLNLISKHREVG